MLGNYCWESVRHIIIGKANVNCHVHFKPHLCVFIRYTGDVWEAEEAEAIQRVSEHIASTESSAAVCLICLETMDSSAAVWQCHKSCHCVFHLLCIQVSL
jgi:hypothetical protein